MSGPFSIACLILASLCTGFLSAAEMPGTANSLVPQSGDVLVILGDGTTQTALYTQYVEDFFLTRYPKLSVRVVNAGVQGSRAADILRRFSSDVAKHHPTHVAVGLGMNDTGDALSLKDDFFRTYRQELSEIDRRIRALDAMPIYLSPTMVDASSARRSQLKIEPEFLELANATSAYFSVWLQEFAEQGNAGFVDLHGPLNQLTRLGRREDSQFSLMQDGIHPTPAGHLVIAAEILGQLGLERPLSRIRIVRRPEGLTVSADGGAVTNLHQATDGQAVSFHWQAEALPWLVADDTAPAVELMNLADRFNREILEVRGLAAGLYELLIDDRLIGRFSSEALEEGLSLQRLTTPQSEQALHIARRNRERTDAAIRPAREEWALEQESFRLEQKLVAEPGNRDLREKFADVQRKLLRSHDRLAKWSQSAADWLEDLREESQPELRQFVIRPVQIADVRGRVLISGMPLSGAAVELHGMRGLTAAGTTDTMGFFQLTARSPEVIEPGAAWLVVLAKMVLPNFVSLEKSGHHVTLRPGVNDIELHFEEMSPGQ